MPIYAKMDETFEKKGLTFYINQNFQTIRGLKYINLLSKNRKMTMQKAVTKRIFFAIASFFFLY